MLEILLSQDCDRKTVGTRQKKSKTRSLVKQDVTGNVLEQDKNLVRTRWDSKSVGTSLRQEIFTNRNATGNLLEQDYDRNWNKPVCMT